jgi:hypothetical protein
MINLNDELPYSIYNDASKFAIGALLKQTDEKLGTSASSP